MSADEIGRAFTQHFYTTIDSNVQQLGPLYRDNSMLTFEGHQFLGAAAIAQKLTSLGKIAHNVTHLDVQPSNDTNNLVIFTVGQIKLDGQENPILFSEFFQLVAHAQGQYYIHNQIFRLCYG